MKSLTQTLAKTAALIEKHVQSTVQEVTGPRPLQDYELVEQVGSGGPGLAWRLYHGKPRNRAEHAHNPAVCVWFLDKKLLSETRQKVGLTKAAEDAFLDVLRADAAQLLKLRHPGVIRVIQALDENKNAMAMVTEPIFASVANVLGNMDNVTKVPDELKGMELGLLEIKHGLLQLTESLSFLHNNAQLVHRAISPETVFITSNGSWKFGGFGFATSVEQATSDGHLGASFHYPEYDVDEIEMPLQPLLNYTAPELTQGGGSPGPCSDMFSLGCLAYHLLSRESLIQCKNNLKAYKNKMHYLTSASFSRVPSELIHGLKSMLSSDELSRPTANDFTGSPFFREDTRLRALRFLDHMLERDNLQKTDFLKALSNMWTDFDVRVLRYKVLPPLCLELRNVVMLPMVLPMVLTIAESQEKADFETSTLPALLPVLSSATGESLLLLVKHAALLIDKVSSEHLSTSVIPMLVRAYDDSDARMQEEVLKRTVAIAKQMDYQVLKQSILPRLHGLALKTTMAAVRVHALLCLSEFVPRLDKPAIKDVLQTLERCTAVDRSPATLMCTLGVASSIYKQFGVEFAAQNILPLLTPLLVAQQLNNQQFSKYMGFVKQILGEIEEKRGLKDGEIPVPASEVKTTKVNGSITQTKASWDDWRIDSKTSESRPVEASVLSSTDVVDWASYIPTKPPPPPPPPPPAASSLSNETTANSNASSVVSFDWKPPPASSQLSNSNEQNSTISTASSYGEDFDPFADWPPRTSTGATAYGVPTTATSPNVDLSTLKMQSQPQPAMRLAPPPATTSGVGRGRGRTSGRSSKAPVKKPQQPPLLDLL